MRVWSTKFSFAHGEITRNGSRGPTPQRPCSGWPDELTGTRLAELPHWPVPVSITLSYGTASTLSYLLNRTLNFRSHGLVGRQVAIYVLVVAVNYFGLILGVGSGLAALGLEYQLARIAAGGCEAVWMYVAMRFLVFRDGGLGSSGGPAPAGEANGADQRPEQRSGHDGALVRPDPR